MRHRCGSTLERRGYLAPPRQSRPDKEIGPRSSRPSLGRAPLRRHALPTPRAGAPRPRRRWEQVTVRRGGTLLPRRWTRRHLLAWYHLVARRLLTRGCGPALDPGRWPIEHGASPHDGRHLGAQCGDARGGSKRRGAAEHHPYPTDPVKAGGAHPLGDESSSPAVT